MTDVNLLVFGCAVSFIALAGAYAYVRECYTRRVQPREAGPGRTKSASRRKAA